MSEISGPYINPVFKDLIILFQSLLYNFSYHQKGKDVAVALHLLTHWPQYINNGSVILRVKHAISLYFVFAFLFGK